MWKRGYSRIRDLAVRALCCKLAEPAKKTHLSTKDLTPLDFHIDESHPMDHDSISSGHTNKRFDPKTTSYLGGVRYI